MIPQEKSAAVARALHQAFGVTGFEDIRQLTSRPTSNLVFRIVVGGTPFLLKIATRAGDPTGPFACMKAAAEAGLAPHVWYSSAEDRIAVTDFVEAAPFPLADALVRIPAALRTLHALPPFPGVPNHLNTTCMFLINQGPALDGFLQRFRTANILPEGEMEDLLARYAQLAAIYARQEPDMVSSHNDLFKPDNILFDGHRVWLVDWEAAFLNDRYADLAVVANLVVSNDAEERVYLQEYFGQPPNQYQLARFFLLQQVAHIFYAMAFLSLGSSGRQLSLNGNAPDLGDFRRRMWQGDVDLADNDTKIVYGRAHWEHLVQNMRQARFNQAVTIASGLENGVNA